MSKRDGSSERSAGREQRLGGGSFYGKAQRKKEQCAAIFTDLRHSEPRRLPEHSHELAFFAVLLEGSYGERYGRAEKQFGPFTLMFRPAGVPHRDEIGPRGLRFFEIELRPEWQKRLEQCSANLDAPLEEMRGGRLLWLAMQVFRETLAAEKPDELSVESLLAEMLASTMRVGGALGSHLTKRWEGESRQSGRAGPEWLARVLEKLQDEFCGKLTLEELSREAGVHPVHLSRVFRRHVGSGVGEYAKRLRIRAACEQMLEPEVSLADLSFNNGFADQSHFTRAFRGITGMTPAVFRELVQKQPLTEQSERRVS